MNILFLCASGHIGGGNRVLLNLWAGLREKGIHVFAVCPFEGPMVDACRDRQLPCRVFDYHQPSWRRLADHWAAHRRWIRLLADWSIDLVHANDATCYRSISLAVWRAGLPSVCHVHFGISEEAAAWLFRRLPRPDAFLFCSKYLRDTTGAILSKLCPKSALVVSHNGLDLSTFEPGRRSPGPPRVAIIANVIPIKGHIEFVEMAEILGHRNPEITFYIIGSLEHDIEYVHHLKEVINNKSLQDRVFILGRRDDVPDLLRDMDVLVSASHDEPFGMSVIEAMSCERPVVATRVGGIPEVIEDGVTGKLVSRHRPRELANATESLLLDPVASQEMGRRGRSRVHRLFSSERQVAQVFSIYSNINASAMQRLSTVQ
jgi:glycosyltransferase involved in cell wall biosynthesis